MQYSDVDQLTWSPGQNKYRYTKMTVKEYDWSFPVRTSYKVARKLG